MNKVITINLNGVAYQLEEQGFDALRAYLDTAGRRLEGNPDKNEILADIEQAIGDKFRSLLGASKTVIVTKEVADIIEGMGQVEDTSGTANEPRPAAGTTEAPRAAAGAPMHPKHLFKIRQGAKIAGVCNGIAAYLNVDVTIVRVAFVLLAVGYGTGLLAYLLLMFVLPEATTPDEVAAAHGTPSATAQEFMRRAKEGYYEGMKSFGNRQAHKEWRRKFKNDMRRWSREMGHNAGHWGTHWNERWGHDHHMDWAGRSFIGLLLSLLSIACVCAIISFVTTGGVFGIYFPGIPIWLGIILIIAVVKIVKWPLRVARGPGYYACSYHCHPFGFLASALMWIVAIYAILWLAGGHVAGLHEIGRHLPPKIHHAAESVKQWWDDQ